MQPLIEGTHSHVFVDPDNIWIWKVYKTTEDVPFPRIDALSEIMFLEELNHPNIPKLINKIIYVDNELKHFAASIPYCGIELTRNLVDSMEITTLTHILTQYFSALEYIHKLNILHCDIKENNILVDPTKEYKLSLIDFGMSIVIQNPKQKMLTQRMYADDYKPPEIKIVELIEPDQSMDIYASGAMLSFLGIMSEESPLLAHDPDDRPDIEYITRSIQSGDWVDW